MSSHEHHDVGNVNPTTQPAAKFLHGLFAVFLLVLALFLLINIPLQTSYFEGTIWFKQPRTWPGFAILGMLFAAIGHTLLVYKQPPATNTLTIGQDAQLLLRAIELCLWFIGFIYAVQYLGYLPSNILFALFLCWRLHIRQPRSLLMAVLVASAIVILFKPILQVSIPGGEAYDLFPTTIARFLNTYL